MSDILQAVEARLRARARAQVDEALSRLRVTAREACEVLNLHVHHEDLLRAALTTHEGHEAAKPLIEERAADLVAQFISTIEQQIAETEGFSEKATCPHGTPVEEDCNDCYIAGDFAYDCAREDRIFGR